MMKLILFADASGTMGVAGTRATNVVPWVAVPVTVVDALKAMAIEVLVTRRATPILFVCPP